MVLLATDQKLLSWNEIEKHKNYVKEHAILQFLHLFKKAQERPSDPFKWGDETEYTIVKFDDEKRKVKVSLRTEDLVSKLEKENGAHWSPEFTIFQVESKPEVPFTGFLDCFKFVEENMHSRREQIRKFLKEDEAVISFSFPSIGVPDYSDPPTFPDPISSGSVFVSDEIVNPGYRKLVQVVNERRGDQMEINVPVFRDELTPCPYLEELSDCGGREHSRAAKEGHIFMDHIAMGIGSCCLQVTFQAADFQDACRTYDQLIPLTPILLALSAASPIYRSTLADVDARWNVLSQAIDDRNMEERGLKPLDKSKFKIDTYRFGFGESYLSESSNKYNDVPLQYDPEHFRSLVEGGQTESFAKFFANVLLRDPLQLSEDGIVLDDEKNFMHCETLLLSIWKNIRFKPPPSNDPSTGWRVEFRTTEVQLTDFENAAYCCFIVLCCRVILSCQLDTLVPISMVAENLERAQSKDALLKERFYFRKDLQQGGEELIEEMSMKEIVNGSAENSGFVGLIPLIRQFLDSSDVEVDTRSRIDEYLALISKRASGEVKTTARWIRDFVDTHSAYRRDSHVPDETVYDLVKRMDDITHGRYECEELFGIRRVKVNHLVVEDCQDISGHGKATSYELELDAQTF